MTTTQLQAFIAVAERRQLTEAARRLGLAQPTLSRQIQALEKELGARLLVRTPRGMVLTDAGERFLAHAREGLEALREGATELHELATEPRGPVGVGALPTVGAYLMPALLASFVRRFPRVRVRLAEALAPELEQRVAEGDLDLAIVNLPIRRSDLVAQKLWEESFALVAPRGHRLAQARRPTLAAVAREPLVVIPGTAATLALQAAAEAQGKAPQVVLEVDHPESLRRMVERGLGVALLPELMARERRGGNIEVVEVRDAPRRTVALVHRGERTLTAAARALKRLLVEKLQRTGARAT